MKRHITVEGTKYLIRGNYTPGQLKERYQAFKKKFISNLTFKEWVETSGVVYHRLDKRF